MEEGGIPGLLNNCFAVRPDLLLCRTVLTQVRYQCTNLVHW